MTELKKTSLWRIAQDLIAFDTVSNRSNRACSDYLANRLNDVGFDVYHDIENQNGVEKSQVIASLGPDTEEGLILSGHIDTVPFANQPGWTKDPLTLKHEDDRVYGRGTSDMKLFLGMCVDAVEKLDLSQLKKPLVFVFTCDEEVGCLGSEKVTPKLQEILKQRPLPQRALIGEPTSFDIVNTHKGIVHFSINLSGVGGHSSRPDLGQNAILPLQKVIETVTALNQELESETPKKNYDLFPDYPHNYLHLAQVNGGLAANMIPEKCHLEFSYRTIPGDDPRELYQRFKSKLDQSSIRDRIYWQAPSVVKAMKKACSHELETCLHHVTGKELKSVSFATDGGNFSDYGIQTFVCGPGEIEQAHTPDESMAAEDFLKGSEFVGDVIRKLLY